MTFTYPAIIHPDENGTWWAEVPDLPGCLSWGRTVDECKAMIADALMGWLYARTFQKLPYNPPSDISKIDGKGDPVVLVTACLTDEDFESIRKDQEAAATQGARAAV